MTYEAMRSACPGEAWISTPGSVHGEAPMKSASRGVTAARGQAAGKSKRHDRIEYRLIFATAFVFFLFTSAIERALPGNWLARANDQSRKSLVQQAREAAGISAAYAFMG